MSRPLPPDPDEQLLELETWDAPDHLSDREGFDALGQDWRWTEGLIDDPEVGR
jgi:hypothetical protein